MRVACINLPHPIPVVRRYMCSYNSPIFLFPPLELMSSATAGRELAGCEVAVIDCVAERLNKQQALAKLEAIAPDLVLTLFGFEIFEGDIKETRWLRKSLPNARFAAFGHYATTFPEEIMRNVELDFLLRGEPELTLIELVQALRNGTSLDGIAGLVHRSPEGGVHINPDRPRNRTVDQLPHPDYGLVNIHDYSEFLLPRPFAVLQTARGCPYTCNFCVRSYGQKLGLRSPDNIMEELHSLVDRFGIRSFRFIDDTFTAIPQRTIEICDRIRNEFPSLVWSCLSRIDTIDEPRILALKRAGCKRVYFGIESGSERILKLYGKDYGINRVPEVVGMLNQHGIEVGTFFMVGHPAETEEDFEQTSRLIKTLAVDFATVGQTVPYPGTSLFEQYRDQVEFSLFPYVNEWKSPGRRRELERWEKRFFREMYFRPSYLARHAVRLMRSPGTTLSAGRALLSYTLGRDGATPRKELV